MELHGKVAVVTGASSGIGEATARALADAGMAVVAVARRAERLEALAAGTAGIVAQPADVTDDAQVRALAEAVRARHGACHVLVNNAGVSRRAPFQGDAALGDLLATMDVNFFGAARCMAAFEDLLVASAPARVINVASVAGKVGIGSPGYASSKFALVGFSEAARPDWASRGIAVCQVNPGFVHTEGFPQDRFRGTPVGRVLLGPEQVAEVIVEVARSGQEERTVPRWYRPLVVCRHVVPPLFWAAARRALGRRPPERRA